MESKYKFKIICGFREEQEYTIDANDVHKAYWLFNNPEFRTVFNNGLALLGTDVRRIVPDYKATMGWNETYKLTNDDFNEMRSNGVLQKLQEINLFAKQVSQVCTADEINVPLLKLYKGKYAELSDGSKYAKEVLGIESK